MSASARIALIHATPLAVAPVTAAFRDLWPDATLANLLDDSLSADRDRDGMLTEAMTARIATLADYVIGAGAEGVLYTCSAFGPAIEAVARAVDVPVLKPNEAMFETAVGIGPRLALVATFPSSIPSMTEEFDATFGARGASLTGHLVADAMEALKAGDAARHDALIAETVSGIRDVDAILLAQFSMAGAAPRASEATSAPVLTSPGTAVEKLRRAVAARSSGDPR